MTLFISVLLLGSYLQSQSQWIIFVFTQRTVYLNVSFTGLDLTLHAHIPHLCKVPGIFKPHLCRDLWERYWNNVLLKEVPTHLFGRSCVIWQLCKYDLLICVLLLLPDSLVYLFSSQAVSLSIPELSCSRIGNIAYLML